MHGAFVEFEGVSSRCGKGSHSVRGRPTYEFPSLLDCRAAFERAMQQQFLWDEKEDWTHSPSPDQDITEL